MKATSWRTWNLRIKSKTLARSLIQLFIAKKVKTNNRRILSYMNSEWGGGVGGRTLSMKWGKKQGSNENTDNL